MVNRVGAAISSLQSFDSILQLIFEQVRNNIHLDVFFIALVDEQRQRVSFPVMYDAGQFWQEPERDLHRATGVAKAVGSGQALLWNRTMGEIEAARNSTNRIGDPTRVAASVIIIPLQSGDRSIGALSVQSYQTQAYNDEHVATLTALAQQVTIAIENARLFEEANKRAQRLLILNEIGREISTLRDLPTLLETIFAQIKKTLPVDLFFIGMYDAARNEMTFPILYDEGRRWDQPVAPVTETTFSGKAILTRQPLLIHDWADPAPGDASPRIIVGDLARTTHSLMYAPMLYAESVIGVLSVQSHSPNAYTAEDLDLLTGIATQVAIAIQNARLLEATRQNAQHLSILNEVARAVLELKDLTDLLEVVHEQASKQISLDAFFVGLHHPETQEISFPFVYDGGRRYQQPRNKVSKGSYLDRLLKGEISLLINRSRAEFQELELPAYDPTRLGEKTRISASAIVAPLMVSDQVIGLISAQSYTINAYDEDDLDLLTRVANQISIAIANSRLYTAAQTEIAERRKMKEQLRTAEAKYRELVETVPAVIYSSETGADGRWFYVSPQIEALLGFTPDEWLANPHLWYRQIHSEDRLYAVNSEALAIRKGTKIEMEDRMYHRDGRLLWIHDESLNVSMLEGANYLVQGILTDVTLRKQAESNLKESEQRHHALFLTAERQARELTLLGEVQRAIAQELDLADVIHAVVNAVAKTFGYTFVSLYLLQDGYLKLQHQVGYKNVIDRISPLEGIMGRVVQTGQPVLIDDVTSDPDFLRAEPHTKSEVSVPLYNGNEIIGVLNVESPMEHPLTEDDLRLMLVLGEQVNVALRRASLHAERAESLRREKHINEFAHAISHTLDLPGTLRKVAELSVQLVGADTGTVNLMSEDGMEQIKAYNYNELPELDTTLARGQGLTWLAYETNEPVIVDEYATHPRALPEWIASGLHAFMAFPIATNQKRLGVLALFNRNSNKKFSQRDFHLIEAIAREVAVSIQTARLFDELQKELEERKRIEAEREAMFRDLEAKNAELERFTYTVSHDLKSPLVTIAGFLGFLEDDFKKGDEKRIRISLRRIHEATLKMHRLLNELLELSRVGRLANPSTMVPFEDLAAEAIGLTEGHLTARQVQVKVEADLPSIFVDRVRLVEVLQNLIVNATKFMGEQGQPMIEIGMEIRQGGNAFFVRDNGMGIAPEYHQRIFGLFDKLDPTTDGTGIGLALVKRILEVHGGKIWVESELGKGATFFFTLAEKNRQE